MIEVWKDVPGYQGKYQVSNQGRIKSLNYNQTGIHKIMNQCKVLSHHKNRVYTAMRIGFRKNRKEIKYLVSRLVWEAFNGPIPAGYQIDHKDNNPENNSLDNLQLLTPSENQKKKYIDNPNLASSYKHCGGLKRKKVYCIELNRIFDCIKDVERELSINQSSVVKCCKGKQKQAKGFTFIYTVDDSANENKIIQFNLF